MLTDFRLKVFKTVADRLSFTKAAAELLISQPAVTKQINELERLLGKPLFLRHGNRISLTDDGVRLLEYANRILALYGELRDAFVEEQGAFSGEIRLGASTTLSQYVLPGLLAKFRKLYPDVRVTLFNGNTEQIERQIADGKLDFGMIEGTASNPALHYELFMDDELVLVTSASNTSFTREEITAADLPALPLVIRENGSGTLDVLSRELLPARLVVAAVAHRDAVGQYREYQALPVLFRYVRVRFGAGCAGRVGGQPAAGGRGGRYGTGPPVQFCHGPRPAQPTDRSFQTILPESL